MAEADQWRASECSLPGTVSVRIPWNNVSESVRRRNPDLFGLGSVAPQERKPSAKPALDGHKKRQPRRKGRLAIVVTLIACRRRLCDEDNSGMGGCKALRDAIAESLGVDDGSPCIRFQYSQVHTTGNEGTIVMIERL